MRRLSKINNPNNISDCFIIKYFFIKNHAKDLPCKRPYAKIMPEYKVMEEFN